MKSSADTKCSRVRIAPSVLSADFSCLGEQIREVVRAGADYIHVDVMDGQFVPNISIGIPVVEALRRITDVPLDVHLMIDRPERFIDRFAEAGAMVITVHVEACGHLDSAIKEIRKMGLRAGVSLNPSTSLTSIEEILPVVDVVLVMTVNPGFGGQKYIQSVTDKIARLRRLLDDRKIPAEIEVDGGITIETAPIAAKAGATILVAGSAIFGSDLGIDAAFKRLRNSIC
jgi:ribulose-phosphate 3-epimerase